MQCYSRNDTQKNNISSTKSKDLEDKRTPCEFASWSLPLGILKNHLQNARYCTNDTLGVDMLGRLDLQQKRSNRRVLEKCGSKNRRKNCRNHKMKMEEPWYAPAFFAHWKIITGTRLQSHWKTTENTKKGKGKKTLHLPQRGRRGYHEQQSHGDLNETNRRSHLHQFQKLALRENCKRQKRHHFSRLMASLIDLSRKAHPQRPPSLLPLSCSLPPSSLARSAAKRPATAAFSESLGLDSTFGTIPHGIVKLNTILLGPITVSPKPVSITISIFFRILANLTNLFFRKWKKKQDEIFCDFYVSFCHFLK